MLKDNLNLCLIFYQNILAIVFTCFAKNPALLLTIKIWNWEGVLILVKISYIAIAMRCSVIVALMLLAKFISAQKEMAQWRFGYRAGVDFLTTPPTVKSGSTHCAFSSATVSDSLGNLLFYVQEGGWIIYNKNDDTLANGVFAGGDGGFQSGWIVPKGNNQYYILMHNSMNYFAPWPFPPMTYYAIVDMNLAAGLGSVTVSNQSISPAGSAIVNKMAVTKHCNGEDYWMLRHSGGFPGSNFYLSYLISSTGISTTAVVSQIGSNQPQTNGVGLAGLSAMHKFSPNGRKLAATFPDRTVELYDFNTSTGQLSNVYKLDSVIAVASPSPALEQAARGIEFSPDGSKLYVSYINKHPHICQFDLSLGSISAIRGSKTTIVADTISNGSHSYAPQLAYDGKIYFVQEKYDEYLGVIHSPNNSGIACNYSPQAVYFNTTATAPFTANPGTNLPNCISNYFEEKPFLFPITWSFGCGLAFFSPPQLPAMAGYSVSSYHWNFNDPLTGSNTSTLSNPSHQYSANGTYTVKLALNYHPCGTDTVKQLITITGLPSVSVTGKTTICKNENTVLNFSGAVSYSINGNAISQSTTQLQPTVTTVYTLTGQDSSACSSKKVFTITVLPCLSVSESESLPGIQIYPNPNDGVFTFESGESGELIILNSMGQELYRKFISEPEAVIDLSNQVKGLYILEWKNSSRKVRLKLLLE